MEKIKEILKEIHLYSNPFEMLVKGMIWIISWGGSVYILKDTTEQVALGSAYFIFSLSLLMEFAEKLTLKKHIISRIIHALFCFVIAAVCVGAIFIIIGITLNENKINAMYNCTKFVLVYMFIDAFLLWVIPDTKNNVKGNSGQQNENKKLYDNYVQKMFEKKLREGNLGHVGEGDEPNE